MIYKYFFRIYKQLYEHSWKLEKLKISRKISAQQASCFPTISRFCNYTRVQITVHPHGKCFIFLK